jgi:glutathione S-transferase
MITLFQFGKAFGLPDPSPFVTKTDVLLKMSQVPYKYAPASLKQAPKEKVPYIEDGGKLIGDSTLIRMHLEQKYNVDFDKHLSSTEIGIAWAVEKMLEEHMYWGIVHERWQIDSNFAKGPSIFFAGVPELIRPLITKMVRKKQQSKMVAHGLGRHTRDELLAMVNRSVDALAQVLGDKPYLIGNQHCGADATAFAFALGALCPLFDTPLRTNAERHRNLVAYCDRMKAEFYPNA